MKHSDGGGSERAYAGFALRAAAYLVDLFLVTLVLLPVRLAFFILNSVWQNSILNATVLFQHNICSIFCFLMTALYFVLTTYLTGQTVGKRIFKIRVVPAEGERLELMNVIYRETVGRYLSSLLLIGYLMALVEEEKKSLHDWLCDTRVVMAAGQAGEQTEEQTEAGPEDQAELLNEMQPEEQLVIEPLEPAAEGIEIEENGIEAVIDATEVTDATEVMDTEEVLEDVSEETQD